jgi:hypothetical protein
VYLVVLLGVNCSTGNKRINICKYILIVVSFFQELYIILIVETKQPRRNKMNTSDTKIARRIHAKRIEAIAAVRKSILALEDKKPTPENMTKHSKYVGYLFELFCTYRR